MRGKLNPVYLFNGGPQCTQPNSECTQCGHQGGFPIYEDETTTELHLQCPVCLQITERNTSLVVFAWSEENIGKKIKGHLASGRWEADNFTPNCVYLKRKKEVV